MLVEGFSNISDISVSSGLPLCHLRPLLGNHQYSNSVMHSNSVLLYSRQKTRALGDCHPPSNRKGKRAHGSCTTAKPHSHNSIASRTRQVGSIPSSHSSLAPWTLDSRWDGPAVHSPPCVRPQHTFLLCVDGGELGQEFGHGSLLPTITMRIRGATATLGSLRPARCGQRRSTEHTLRTRHPAISRARCNYCALTT